MEEQRLHVDSEILGELKKIRTILSQTQQTTSSTQPIAYVMSGASAERPTFTAGYELLQPSSMPISQILLPIVPAMGNPSSYLTTLSGCASVLTNSGPSSQTS